MMVVVCKLHYCVQGLRYTSATHPRTWLQWCSRTTLGLVLSLAESQCQR
jgi:hypothetical protein